MIFWRSTLVGGIFTLALSSPAAIAAVGDVVKAPLEGPNAQSTAYDNLLAWGINCNAVTSFGFVKVIGTAKVFKAQCDKKAWYVMYEYPSSGEVKVQHWTGTGEPH